ncbi:mitochondrial metal transporter [Coemansia aciculifera]|uniref:Mitochondrial metal transporter n=1 Tax=Coemansia aciculifera TaxID=417176 RepID=A0ACC1M6H7_9FUNG|nr:mitochondrial metal transporter [Coemansia aciculifera]
MRMAHRHHSLASSSSSRSGSRWSIQDMEALKNTASSFSSCSHILFKELKGSSSGHSHSHSHSHGLFSAHTHSSEEAASKIEMIEHHQAGSRITLIGMGANFGMSVAKGLAGVYFHSSALLADAAHSLSDILGDLVTLYTFRKSRQPADATHPFGYGRYEALGTLFVSAFLVAAGLGIGSHALDQVLHYLPGVMGTAMSSAPSASSSLSSLMSLAGHAHDGGAHSVVDGAVVVDPRAIWFAVGSIGINEALFQATMKVGRRTKSDVLVANAWHHRSDALTSLVSVGAIGGAIMGFPILDAIGGLVVSAMLAKSGGQMALNAIREITDTPPPAQVTSDVADALALTVADTPEVRGVANIRCRKSGPFIHVCASLQFAPSESASSIEHAVWHVRAGLRQRLKYVQNIDIDVVTGGSKQGLCRNGN